MAGSVIGSVASGIIGGLGDDKAEQQFQQGAAAAQQIFQPQPFQAQNSFGAVNADGQFKLHPFGHRVLGMTNQLAGQTFGRATNFDRRKFADRLMDASNRVNDKRESQAFSSLESKLFNRQGASTGTQRQIADFGADLEDRRFQRALQAEVGANQVGSGLNQDFIGALGLVNDFSDRRIAAQQQGLFGAQALAPYAINNPAQAQAGAFRAQNTQDFFDGLGGVVGGAAQTGINFLRGGSGGGSSSSGGGFFNPNAINFGSNPFTSLGFS